MIAQIDGGIKCFLDIISSDLNDLLAPTFPDPSWFDALHIRVVETVGTNESAFPDSESTLLWHQLVHFAKHIPQMGPLAGWWCFSGERAMSSVKDFVPEGGQSMEKVVMNNFDSAERAKTRAAYNFSKSSELFQGDTQISKNPNGGYVVTYNSLRFELLTDITSTFEGQYTLYEMNKLLDAMIQEVFKQTGSEVEALNSSPVYRLYFVHKLHTHQGRFDKSLYEWFQCLYQVHAKNKLVVAAEQVANYILDERGSAEILDEFGFERACNDGYITYTDAECASCFVGNQEQPPVIYKNATVYGLRFSGRGQEYRERKEPVSNATYGAQPALVKYNTFSPRNRLLSCNNGNTYLWQEKEQYSSWCKYRSPRKQVSDHHDPQAASTVYAQLNYFFHLNVVGDGVLHGVPFGNIVERVHTTEEYVDVVSAEPFCSYRKDPHVFVPLTNLVATPILVQAVTFSGLPIPLERGKRFKSEENEKYYAADDNNVAYKFFLMPMYPMNAGITYKKSNNHLYNLSK